MIILGSLHDIVVGSLLKTQLDMDVDDVGVAKAMMSLATDTAFSAIGRADIVPTIKKVFISLDGAMSLSFKGEMAQDLFFSVGLAEDTADNGLYCLQKWSVICRDEDHEVLKARSSERNAKTLEFGKWTDGVDLFGNTDIRDWIINKAWMFVAPLPSDI